MSERDGSVPRIVAGVDGSPSSLAALHWAVRQAGLTGGTVEVVIAWRYPAAATGYAWVPIAADEPVDYAEIAQKVVAEAISNVDTAGGDVRMSTRVQQGCAAQVLIDAAVGADLLVVGSRGHGGFSGALLGSVSMHCVHHAPCPVVVVRDGRIRQLGGGSGDVPG
jgi:nucleotide-binding universal stress UspA family protein